MKVEIVKTAPATIHVPDESDEGLMTCAESFDNPFTAEEFCARLYRSHWGMGSWVSGKLGRLRRQGKISTVGKCKGKTLYAVNVEAKS